MAGVRREQAKGLMTAAEYDQAEQLLLLALTLHERLNSLHEQAFDLIELGNIARFRKQFDKAIACLTRALALARKANDPLMVAYALHDIGILEHWRGNPAQALPILEVALHQGTLDLALGRAAELEGDDEGSRAHVRAAEQRLFIAEVGVDGEAPLTRRSDDARIAVRVLRRALSAT